MKKTLSLVLAILMLLGMTSTAFAANVPEDVLNTDVEEAATRLVQLGIMIGNDKGDFEPEENITRAEFAAVMTRLKGLEKESQANVDTVFGDVSQKHWASGYINTANHEGIIEGMGIINGVNTFGPELNVTYEQAVAMVTRTLGYETEAQDRGGYPVGNLLVAADLGLLQDVNGVSGQMIKRGQIAKLTDNALDVPEMIKVGYGENAKYIKSGTEGTEKQTLFDNLDLTIVEDKITKVNKENKEITLGNKELKVLDKDFDFKSLEGVTMKAWYNSENEIVLYEITDKAKVKFDALEVTKYRSEIKLITENAKYKVNKDTKILLDDEEGELRDLRKGDKYNFAKVVLNEDDEVEVLEAYNLDRKILVKDVYRENLVGYDRTLRNIDEYTILKDGTVISHNDLKDEDLVIYNVKQKVATVLTNIIKGELDRVYQDNFRFEGEYYSNEGYSFGHIQFLLEDQLRDINSNILNEMKKNGDVEVYFDFENNPVFIIGETEEVNFNFGMITKDPTVEKHNRNYYVTFEYMDDRGKIFEEEFRVDGNQDSSIVDEYIVRNDRGYSMTLKEFKENFAKGTAIDYKLDNSGYMSELEKMYIDKSITNSIDINDKYADGYKLQNDTLVFWNEGGRADADNFKDYKVEELGNIYREFERIDEGTIYVDRYDNVIAIIATGVDLVEETTWNTATVKIITENNYEYFLTLDINGQTKAYRGSKADLNQDVLEVNNVVNVLQGENNIIKEVKLAESKTMTLTEDATENSLKGVIEDLGEVTLTLDGVFYNSNNELDEFSNFKADDVITIHYNEEGTVVNVVIGQEVIEG